MDRGCGQVSLEPRRLARRVLLLWRAMASTTAWRRPWAWALTLAVLYAITDEFHQGGVAGRHAAAVDVGIDAAGALVAVMAIGLIRSRRS